MEKIVLTPEEVEIIELQLAEKINFYNATDRQKVVIMDIIDRAKALMRELDAYDELGDDLILWYYNKYKSQA